MLVGCFPPQKNQKILEEEHKSVFDWKNRLLDL